MQKALAGHKAGSLDVDGSSFKLEEVYQGSEDLLTSAVFQNLAHLPDSWIWYLLVYRTGLGDEANPRLLDAWFWPSLPPVASGGIRIEPDLVFRFWLEAEDIPVWLVVEAKLPWAHQQADQLAEQLQSASEASQRHEGRTSRVLSLALAGC